jgi:hypothetical protein
MLLLTVCASRARADAESDARVRYERALELYESGVYDAALVELKRAYELRPSYKLLYNIGQVRMAMNDYAGALEAYRQYLREAGPRLPSARRDAVQAEVGRLEQHVAELRVECDVSQAEVLVDDLLVGTTPLSTPLLVNAGLRRVMVRHPGHGSEIKRVSLAGGDHQEVRVTLLVSDDPGKAQTAERVESKDSVRPAPAALAPPVATNEQRPGPTVPAATSSSTRTLRIVSWSVTGGLLASALTTGLFAMKSSNELESMRKHELVSRDQLREQETHTSRLAIASDVLTGLSVVAAAASLWVTLRRERLRASSATSTRTRQREVELGLGPRGLALHTRF